MSENTKSERAAMPTILPKTLQDKYDFLSETRMYETESQQEFEERKHYFNELNLLIDQQKQISIQPKITQ